MQSEVHSFSVCTVPQGEHCNTSDLVIPTWIVHLVKSGLMLRLLVALITTYYTMGINGSLMASLFSCITIGSGH